MDVHERANIEAVDADAVADYLKRHPDFFTRRDDLLTELQLTHPTGGAVSLLERQVAILRDRNMEMRHRLTNLIDNARDNDRLFELTRKLVLQLLEATTLDGLVDACVSNLRQEFKVEFASLVLFGNPLSHRGTRARIASFTDARTHMEGLLGSNKAVCGTLRPEEVRFLFPDKHAQIGSAAVVPLTASYPLGMLAIASSDPSYFRSSMGTLFLGYIAEVLERLLPRYLKPFGQG
ncbi:MAG: DUF484 family protein [Spongiibacteraceae bacterium]|nr:DUF484 family protein [Spongiibacteraceae bacterium]